MANASDHPQPLYIVSNRLPFNVRVDNDKLVFQESAGGLVTGLASYIESCKRANTLSEDHAWIGWPGSTVTPPFSEELKREALAKFQSYPVFLSEEEMDQFYFGFCNSTIWPLFHYFPSFTVYQGNLWEQYKHVNEVFCDAVMEVVKPDGLVWVHDYHLMLLPRLLKAKAPDLMVGFFLHIPFPSFEVFRLLPGRWRREILEGLLGADLIGFHTHEYGQHFLQSVLRILGHEQRMGQILTPERAVKVETFPMGIDFDKFSKALENPETKQEAEELRATLTQVNVILSVDRLDYSKGILNRLEGFESFLEANARYHGKVVLLMVVVPSRIGVSQYDLMKRQIEELVGKINGRFGKIGWTPVVYQYRSVPFQSLAALYSVSDICLVTPLRDGMNLVAKEYVATRKDGTGVLILSEMAGAAKELAEAIIVNPNNREEIAEALSAALEIPVEEQKRRNQIMQRRLQRHDVMRWARDFVNQLAAMREVQNRIQAKLLPDTARTAIVGRYRQSKRRVLFLDYDGATSHLTQYTFRIRLDEAKVDTVQKLSTDPRNTVVVLSGRPRDSLAAWFGHLPVGLVAEHGTWLKASDGPWRISKNLTSEWKKKVLPIFEIYADRLPGAFVEEKEYSAVWHYRAADPDQASLLAAEMTDHLLKFTSQTDLQVFQGNKRVEIRHAGINKGTAALDWLSKRGSDFVLAIGDDSTDEDLFSVLPDSAVSIQVGFASTHARYNLRTADEAMDLLKSLAEVTAITREPGQN
jgi:trehalose 6-phosphate synthase/phosphatase